MLIVVIRFQVLLVESIVLDTANHKGRLVESCRIRYCIAVFHQNLKEHELNVGLEKQTK